MCIFATHLSFKNKSEMEKAAISFEHVVTITATERPFLSQSAFRTEIPMRKVYNTLLNKI